MGRWYQGCGDGRTVLVHGDRDLVMPLPPRVERPGVSAFSWGELSPGAWLLAANLIVDVAGDSAVCGRCAGTGMVVWSVVDDLSRPLVRPWRLDDGAAQIGARLDVGLLERCPWCQGRCWSRVVTANVDRFCAQVVVSFGAAWAVRATQVCSAIGLSPPVELFDDLNELSDDPDAPF